MASMPLRRLVAATALAGALLAFTAPRGRAETEAAPASGPTVGDAAVAWTVKDMVNGDPVTLKELRGRVVLFEFIGTT